MRFDQGKLWMHTGDEGIMDKEGYLQSASAFYRYIFSVVEVAFVNSRW